MFEKWKRNLHSFCVQEKFNHPIVGLHKECFTERLETVGLYIPHSDKLRLWNSKAKYCLFTVYTGKPVGLLFGSV